jgi:hypothetical protein
MSVGLINKTVRNCKRANQHGVDVVRAGSPNQTVPHLPHQHGDYLWLCASILSSEIDSAHCQHPSLKIGYRVADGIYWLKSSGK